MILFVMAHLGNNLCHSGNIFTPGTSADQKTMISINNYLKGSNSWPSNLKSW